MFALEQLNGSSEVRGRHARYYGELARRAFQARYGSEHGLWLRRLHADHENFREALGYFRGPSPGDGAPAAPLEGGPCTGVELAGLLGWFWEAYDLLHEGTQELESSLKLGDHPLAWQYFGTLLRHQSDYPRALEAYQRSLELYRAEQSWSGCGEVLAGLGEVAFRQGSYDEARNAFQQALELAQRSGQDRLLIDAWNDLGRVAWGEGHSDEARKHHLNSLRSSESVQYRHGMAWSHNALGEIDRAEKRHEQAAEHFSASARLFEQLHEQGPRALALQNLAFVRLAEGQVREAGQRFLASMQLWQKAGARHGLALSLVGMAGVALATGSTLSERAAGLLGLADRLLEAIGARLESTDRNDYERIASLTRSRLASEDFAREYQRGRERSPEELMADWPEQRAPSNPAGLTNRELEVLRLLAEGLSNAHISEQLIMSPHTVTVHLKTIYRKLEVHNRTAASRWARQHGLCE